MHDIEFALNAKRTRKLKRKWTGHGHGQARPTTANWQNGEQTSTAKIKRSC